jgi:hypothetical protein
MKPSPKEGQMGTRTYKQTLALVKRVQKKMAKEGLREIIAEYLYDQCSDYMSTRQCENYAEDILSLISEQGVPEKDDMEIFSGEDKRTMRKTLDKSIGWNAAIDEMKRRLT